MIYGPIKDSGVWRTGYSSELYTLYNEPDIVKVVKTGRLRWLGQLCRMQELDPCRQLTVITAEGTRLVGKPKLSWWFESVEEDLNKMGWREELETEVAGSRTMEGKCGRG